MLNLPPDKERLLGLLVDRLTAVPNVRAVVLGGSYASGHAGPNSDLDIGIYYRTAEPLASQEVRAVAESVSAPGATPTVTELYGWGAWLNGGAWIQTPAGKVDFLYRSIDQVEAVIDEGQRGVVRHDYDQQPPFGFRSVVYFGETDICLPLHDPHSEISQLKRAVAEYPERMRDSIVRDSLWSAEFSLDFCRRFAAVSDVTNAVGCMARIAHNLLHALFAINRRYFVNDKHAKRIVSQFLLAPPDFILRLEEVLGAAGSHPAELCAAVDRLSVLWSETVQLTAGSYQPRFRL